MYLKFEKVFHFPSFPGVKVLRVLIDKLGGFSFYTLHPDRLFLNFACKWVLIQAISLPNKKIRSLPTALKKCPTRNVMKSSLSKQRCEISSPFQ